MPGRNLSGGESHFSFFFVAHFSWTKLDFCHRPPLSNVKGKVMQGCFLKLFLLEKFNLEFES